MDALHPRLLVNDFGAVFAFYAAVLPELAGAQLSAGGPEGPYASWDVGGQGLLSMFDARMMGRAVGTDQDEKGRPVIRRPDRIVFRTCRRCERRPSFSVDRNGRMRR